MARPLRIEFAGAWYHVMNRGANRAKIFSDVKDFSLFLNVLKESCNFFNISVAAYCLMSNHYHILLNTPEGNLSRFMRHLNGVYTQKYNRRHKKDGSLFRGRYKSVLVQEDNHLMGVMRYIHFNPVKAKIVKDIKDYRWSSHILYLKRITREDWINVDCLLISFSNKRRQAINAYKEYLSHGVDSEVEKFYSKKNQSSIFGDDTFIKKIKEIFIYSDERPNIETKEKRIIQGEGILERVNNEICKSFRIAEDKLYQIKRGEENIPRFFAIALSRELSGLRMPEIASKYKIPTYRTVGTICYRFNERIKKNKKLAKLYKKLKLACSQGRT